MVCVAPRAATRPTRPAVTCRFSWRCAVAGAEFALHQHAVDPAAKFEPDGTEHANLAKAEALMQTDRGVIPAAACHSRSAARSQRTRAHGGRDARRSS